MGSKLTKIIKRDGSAQSFARSSSFTDPNGNRLWSLLLVFVPVSYCAYWEIQRYYLLQDKLLEKQDVLERSLGFPYYGKTWGMSTDYSIETSLKDGDLAFFSYSEKPLHFHKLLQKKLLNSFGPMIGKDYDEVGVIFWKNSVCYVVSLTHNRLTAAGEDAFKLSFGNAFGVTVEKYSDKIARTLPRIVSLRRLDCDSSIRKRIPVLIENMMMEWSHVKYSTFQELCTQLKRAKQFDVAQAHLRDASSDKCKNSNSVLPDDVSLSKKDNWLGSLRKNTSDKSFGELDLVGFEIERQWSVLAHRCVIENLRDILKDLVSPRGTNSNSGVEHEFLNRISLVTHLISENESQLEKHACSSRRPSNTRPFFWLSSLLTRPFSYFLTHKLLQEPQFQSQSQENEADHTIVPESENRRVARMTGAGFIVELYQRAKLLPCYPPPQDWCTSDLLMLQNLCCGSVYPGRLNLIEYFSDSCNAMNETRELPKLRSARLLPKLSQPYHIRDDTAELQRSSLTSIFRRRPPIIST